MPARPETVAQLVAVREHTAVPASCSHDRLRARDGEVRAVGPLGDPPTAASATAVAHVAVAGAVVAVGPARGSAVAR